MSTLPSAAVKKIRIGDLLVENGLITAEQLPDVACVALNRLPPRYIRHEVDLAFYLTERERLENERSVDESVQFAFEFVQARTVMRARR